MDPHAPELAARNRLVRVAARIIQADGHEALTLPRLAADASVPLVEIFDHYADLDAVRAAVGATGLANLAATMAAIEPTDDPLADLALTGVAYLTNATIQPDTYRAMFLDRLDHDGLEASLDVFGAFIAWVRRAYDAGVLHHGEPHELALELWVLVHGAGTLHTANRLSLEDLTATVTRSAIALFVASGADRAQAERSVGSALARVNLSPPV